MRSLRSLILRWCDGLGDDEGWAYDDDRSMTMTRCCDAGRAFSYQLRLVPPNLFLPPFPVLLASGCGSGLWLRLRQTAYGYLPRLRLRLPTRQPPTQPVGEARAASRNVFLIFAVRLCVRCRCRWLLSASDRQTAPNAPFSGSLVRWFWPAMSALIWSDLLLTVSGVWLPPKRNENSYRNTWIPFCHL